MFASILAPFLVGVLTENKTQAEWQSVFGLSSIVYVVAIFVFLFLCDAETQDWAKTGNNKKLQQEEQIRLTEE